MESTVGTQIRVVNISPALILAVCNRAIARNRYEGDRNHLIRLYSPEASEVYCRNYMSTLAWHWGHRITPPNLRWAVNEKRGLLEYLVGHPCSIIGWCRFFGCSNGWSLGESLRENLYEIGKLNIRKLGGCDLYGWVWWMLMFIGCLLRTSKIFLHRTNKQFATAYPKHVWRLFHAQHWGCRDAVPSGVASDVLFGVCSVCIWMCIELSQRKMLRKHSENKHQ